MRHSTLTTSVVVLSALVASAVLLLVVPRASEAETPQGGTQLHGEAGDKAGSKLAKESEEDFPPYSESVDNASGENFEAAGWKPSSAGTDIYGQDYLAIEGDGSSAKYTFDIPAKDTYSVFAWWPIGAGAASSVEIKIDTGEEIKTETVNQSKDGGYWVPIGEYEMNEGQRNVVEISAGSGEEKVVADAVAVMRGVEGFPADPETIGNNSETKTGEETMFSAAGSKYIPQRKLMRRAKSFLGTPYDYAHTRCRWGMSRIDCSCFTRHVYKKWRKIPDSPSLQWYQVKKMSVKFRKKSRLKRGDLVFFDENRNGRINGHDLVAIYAGNGKILLASSYFGKVAKTDMKYIRGFKGGKRLRHR